MTAMTATVDQELKYVFACIEDERLVENRNIRRVDFGGPAVSYDSFIQPIRKVYPRVYGDYVALVPETPILYSPSNTFWNRVAERPPVEYFTGHWHIWEDGPLPVPIPPEDPSFISVFLVPVSQYYKLNEERELTELRVENILKHPQTLGATASTFVKDQLSNPISMGRPKDTNFYHIPLSLFYEGFAQFQQDIVSGPLDRDLSPLAQRWMRELSELFDNEEERTIKFHELLSDLLDGYRVSKKEIGSYPTGGGIDPPDFLDLEVKPLAVKINNETTSGTSDAVFEVILYDLEGVRLILEDKKYKGDWRKTRIPSVLLVHNGPNIQALGAVYLEDQYIEVLSPSLPLYFNEYNTRSMENLLRFMTALRRLFRSLYAVYKNPNGYAVELSQVGFPYPHSYQSSGSSVRFTYIERVSTIRLVFTARTEDDKNIIVKFGSGRYGAEAHRAAAESGLAPGLLSYSTLTGGWWMAVMETLDGDFIPCDEYDKLEKSCKDVIKRSVDKFHSLGFVHGDLRDTNIFVRKQQDENTWDCQLIDYDWAGRPGDVVYPIGVYSNALVWRPDRFMDGQLITVEHDRSTMEEFLRRRTVINRFCF